MPYSSAGSTFVGREREFGALVAQLNQLSAGRGGLAVVVGEPGIGKSRLAEELAEIAGGRGVSVLWGRCSDRIDSSGQADPASDLAHIDRPPAFWPWIQILRACLRGHAPERLRAELEGTATEIGRLLPELNDALPDLPAPAPMEPQPSRFRLLDAVVTCLTGAAVETPLLLVLDDLQWADAPSLQLLRLLAPALGDVPLLVLALCRDSDEQRGAALPRLLSDLGRLRCTVRLDLAGLGESESHRLASEIAGIELDPFLAEKIHRETDGNPFYIAEIVRLLASESRLQGSPQGTAGLGLPQSIRAAIQQRLDGLTPACLRLLTLAAVMGRSFSLAILLSVEKGTGFVTPDGSGQDLSLRLLDLLDEAIAKQLVLQEAAVAGRFRFAHALVRETLYAGIGPGQLVRLHGMVGEALERLDGGRLRFLSELAHHFLQAAPGGEVARGVSYARVAADQARVLFAYEEAAALYQRALEALELQEVPERALQCELILGLGAAENSLGERARGRDCFLRVAGLARELGSAEQFARAALGLEQVGECATNEIEVALLEEALRGLPNEDSALRARVLGRLTRMLYWSGAPERRIELSRLSVEMARRLDDPATLVDALHARLWALWDPGHLEERLLVAGEVVQLAGQLRDIERALRGHAWRVTDLLSKGDLTALDEEIAVYARLAKELRQPFYIWRTTVIQGCRASIEGRYAEMEQRGEAALAIRQRLPTPSSRHAYVLQTLGPRREQGRVAELVHELETFTAGFPSVAVFRAALAAANVDLDHSGEASVEFERLASNGFAAVAPDENWLLCMVLLAEVCTALRDRRRAALLYDLLLPYADRAVTCAGAVAFAGPVASYLGQLALCLGRHEQAERHFQAGLALSMKLRSLPWQARTAYDYAALLLQRERAGDHTTAIDLLEGALAVSRDLGMALLEQQAERRLSFATVATNAGSRDAAPASRLTRRELEVLRPVAAGKSNLVIAELLVLSERTVARHITNIYNKIGARSRADATAFAFRQGLVELTAAS